jgi:MFS family permease
MICPTKPTFQHAEPAWGSSSSPARRAVAGEKPYGVPFWRAYVANTLVMVAVALLFRYADFVTMLGGTEWHLGWIVGLGMVGSLTVRLFLGTGIDRYGPRWIWPGSLVLLAACSFAHLAIQTHSGPAVYLLRVGYCSALAGIFGSSMTFVAGRAPVARMAEMIGMLGTAGFLGIVLGTQLGDLLLGTPTIERWQVDRMFVVAGTLALCAIPFAGLATAGHRPGGPPRRRTPLVWLLRRYNPGTVLLVGIAMGAGIGLPGVFLRTYAAGLDISRIGLFFAVYAPAAITTRLLTRRLPEQLGLPTMILIGLCMLAVSQLFFLTVGREWQLILPGIGYGIAHAILFPATVAAGSQAFPRRNRGLGTVLMLATFDAGQLIGAPMAGAIVHFSHLLGLPAYPTLFVSVAVLMSLVALTYLASRRKSRGPKARPPHRRRAVKREAAGAVLAKTA